MEFMEMIWWVISCRGVVFKTLVTRSKLNIEQENSISVQTDTEIPKTYNRRIVVWLKRMFLLINH